jgi:serine/threonine-protein kinase
MSLPRCVVAAFTALIILGSVQASRADGNFGAIAYSPCTGCYGYSFGLDCQASAERVALQNCCGLDRRVVAWVAGGYAALVVNNNGGYGAAWSTNCRADAEQAALGYAGGCGAHILCWIASGT